MAGGLYVHIPFCLQKCSYCDFYSLTRGTADYDYYISLLMREARLRRTDMPIDTVFLGGGTPSLLSPAHVSAVLQGLSRYFAISGDAEVTMEANPGTLTLDKLVGYRAAGINRLSLGVQSLDDYLLRLLGRVHTAAEALATVQTARGAGFENLSCDVIYGIPGQSMVSWQSTLRDLTELSLPHISLYALEIHDDTPLGRARLSGQISEPDEDLAADMYAQARELLPARKLAQYEISNFAIPGWESRHNLNYWQNGEYIGLGPAAWSYQDGVRTGNVTDLKTYSERILAGEPAIVEREQLDGLTAEAETVILALRTTKGLDNDSFASRFGHPVELHFSGVIDELVRSGLLLRTDTGYALPPSIVPIANQVFTRFLP